MTEEKETATLYRIHSQSDVQLDDEGNVIFTYQGKPAFRVSRDDFAGIAQKYTNWYAVYQMQCRVRRINREIEMLDEEMENLEVPFEYRMQNVYHGIINNLNTIYEQYDDTYND